MRDHRLAATADIDGDVRNMVGAVPLTEITRKVQEHRTAHPGSVKRSSKANARAAAKRAAASRRGNR